MYLIKQYTKGILHQNKKKSLNDLLVVPEMKFALRIMEDLYFGATDKHLIIQAPVLQHFYPKRTLSIEEYSSFEVMLFLDQKDVPASWQEYGSLGDVFSYVPRDKIEDLIYELEKKYGPVRIGEM